MAGGDDIMTNRILDCIDGRCLSSRLTSYERRLLEKIEAGLRNRTDDYLATQGPYHAGAPSLPSARPRPSAPPERSALSSFLERTARRHLDAV